jgi:hypothetical protein
MEPSAGLRDGRNVAGVERGGRPKVELDGFDLLARGRPNYLAARGLQLTGSSPEVPNELATARELGYGSNGGGGVRVAAVAQLQLADEAPERPEGGGGCSPSGTRRPAVGLVAAEVGVAGVPSEAEPERGGAWESLRCSSARSLASSRRSRRARSSWTG